MMFLLNLAYHLGVGSDIDGINSAIVLPAENHSYRFDGLPEHSKLLMDPQLYLAGLDITTCQKTCEHLATYPWFQINNIPVLEEGQKKTDFRKLVAAAIGQNWKGQLPSDVFASCYSAIQFQVDNKCTHIILPSPLINAREDEATTQAEWLDEGLRAVEEIEPTQPIIATVAIDEMALNDSCFAEGGFLDTIVDQYSAREGYAGVYIVVNQMQKRQIYASSDIVNRCYMALTQKFSRVGTEHIIINFADLFGLACISLGATFFATGPTVATRSLCFKNFEDASGGLPLPHFFSRYSISEYLSKSELDSVTSKKLLRRIEDVTEYSLPLIESLRAGRDSSTVPSWVESRNNVTSAKKHFIKSIYQMSEAIRMESDRKAFVRHMLEDVEMVQSYLKQKIGTAFPAKRAPVEKWLECMELHGA